MEDYVLHSPRMNVRSIDHSLFQFLEVPWCDRLWIGQLFGKYFWYANLICTNIWIGRDHRPGSIINPFTHHVHAKKTLFLFQNLFHTWFFLMILWESISLTIVNTVDTHLKGDPCILKFLFCCTSRNSTQCDLDERCNIHMNTVIVQCVYK